MNWYESSVNDGGTESELVLILTEVEVSVWSYLPPVTDFLKRERVKKACLYLLTFPNKLGTIGTLYFWGGRDTTGDYEYQADVGFDCSGSVETIGIYACLESAEWFSDCHIVPDMRHKMVIVTDYQVGDVAFYGDTHEAIVCYVDDAGIPYVMSMSGGSKDLYGTNPNARAKLVRADYWNLFSEIRRFPSMV